VIGDGGSTGASLDIVCVSRFAAVARPCGIVTLNSVTGGDSGTGGRG